MDGNAYIRILETVHRDTPGAGIRLHRGVVCQSMPLRVSVAGLDLPADIIYINAALVKSSTSDGVETDVIAERASPALELGDQVLLITEDDQIFYVLCKVVRAT